MDVHFMFVDVVYLMSVVRLAAGVNRRLRIFRTLWVVGALFRLFWFELMSRFSFFVGALHYVVYQVKRFTEFGHSFCAVG